MDKESSALASVAQGGSFDPSKVGERQENLFPEDRNTGARAHKVWTTGRLVGGGRGTKSGTSRNRRKPWPGLFARVKSTGEDRRLSGQAGKPQPPKPLVPPPPSYSSLCPRRPRLPVALPTKRAANIPPSKFSPAKARPVETSSKNEAAFLLGGIKRRQIGRMLLLSD
ncbi:hypothetical protein KM043_012715 [Ampulex compressa]|nr:hypothetical protein KM043_012715 [Ampulex compressa]